MSLIEFPTKVVLDSRTNVSLNDRFTKFTKERLKLRKQMGLKTVRESISGLGYRGLASERNRRLAQSMVNRPSVQAALKLKKKSIKQRLNARSNSRKRLSHGPIPALNVNEPLSVRSRLNSVKSSRPRLEIDQLNRVHTSGFKETRMHSRRGRPRSMCLFDKRTKESLDDDLDNYMSKSKSRLDHDLDAYMSQAR